jgi:hypothetical protein
MEQELQPCKYHMNTGVLLVIKKNAGTAKATMRLFRTLKERTRRFYNNLPSDSLENLESFMRLFMVWYNHLRRHQGLGRIPVEVALS